MVNYLFLKHEEVTKQRDTLIHNALYREDQGLEKPVVRQELGHPPHEHYVYADLSGTVSL